MIFIRCGSKFENAIEQKMSLPMNLGSRMSNCLIKSPTNQLLADFIEFREKCCLITYFCNDDLCSTGANISWNLSRHLECWAVRLKLTNETITISSIDTILSNYIIEHTDKINSCIHQFYDIITFLEFTIMTSIRLIKRLNQLFNS